MSTSDGSGSSCRTTSSYVAPSCRMGSQSPWLRQMWSRRVSWRTCWRSMFTNWFPPRWKPSPRGCSLAVHLALRDSFTKRTSTCPTAPSVSRPAALVRHRATFGGTPTEPSSAVNSATPANVLEAAGSPGMETAKVRGPALIAPCLSSASRAEAGSVSLSSGRADGWARSTAVYHAPPLRKASSSARARASSASLARSASRARSSSSMAACCRSSRRCCSSFRFASLRLCSVSRLYFEETPSKSIAVVLRAGAPSRGGRA
mmetsp:Transcript_75485/g.213408  ORF Transcript_75485/g.213408 Transcript_75485/m.213408 type:complete len:260 (+) Transcript_75485:605-1384(+)